MNRIHKNQDLKTKQPNFSVILNRYAEAIRVAPPRHASRLAHSTFQGRDPSGETSGRQNRCPCADEPNQGNHPFSECAYVNPAVRPTGWKGQKEAKDRFKKAANNPRFNAAYQRALDQFQPHRQKPEPKAEPAQPAPAKTSDKTPKSRNGFAIFIPKTAISELLRPTTDIALNAAQTKAPTRNDVWCYDTGATLHICNNRALLSNYRPAVSSVQVGNTETTILGFGTATIRPTESLDGTSFPLLEVAYAPGFHLNLLSADRAASAGIFLRGKDDILEESDGTPIYRLNRKSSVYLIR